MITLEQVEKLKSVAGVSYNEAKEALDQTQGDILEAVLLLERAGKVKKPENNGSVSSKETETKKEEQPKKKEDDSFKKFFDWIKHVLHLGNTNDFVVYKEDKDSISIPLTIFVIMLLFAFWVVFPLMIVGLFFSFRYRFAGPNFTNDKINRTVDTLSNATLRTGEVVKEAVNNLSKEFKKDE